MAFIPASEIPNAPNVDPTMPGVEYPNIPAIRNEPIGFRVNMEGRAAALQQKELPSSFAEGYARVANAAGRGQAAMGKAIESGSHEIGRSLVALSGIFGRIAQESLDSKDTYDKYRLHAYKQNTLEQFNAEVAEKRLTPVERMQLWEEKYVPQFMGVSEGLGVRPTTKDLLDVDRSSFVETQRNKIRTDASLEQLRQDEALRRQTFQTALDNDDLVTASEITEEALGRRDISEAQAVQQRRMVASKAQDNVIAEGLSTDKGAEDLLEQTKKVAKGEKPSKEYDFLEGDPVKNRQAMEEAQRTVNNNYQTRKETFIDDTVSGTIKPADLEKEAKARGIRPSDLAVVQKSITQADPAYNPQTITGLNTRLQKYDPQVGKEMQSMEEFNKLYNDIQVQAPKALREQMHQELKSKWDAAHKGEKSSPTEKALGDYFEYADRLGKQGSFGPNGLDKAGKPKTDEKSTRENYAVFSRIQTIKDEMRRFADREGDKLTLPALKEHFESLLKEDLSKSGSSILGTKAKPPETIPPAAPSTTVQPTTAPSGYPAAAPATAQPPGTTSLMAPGEQTIPASQLPQGKLVSRVLGEPPPTLPYERLARQQLGLEQPPKATFVRGPATAVAVPEVITKPPPTTKLPAAEPLRPQTTPAPAPTTPAPVEITARATAASPLPSPEHITSMAPEFRKRAAQLNRGLGGVLAGKAEAFVEAGVKYGVDPVLLMAIAVFETGNGTSHSARRRNNIAGIMNPRNPSQHMVYNTIEEGIDAQASLLKRGYIGKGLRTIAAIARKYSPPGASNDPYGTNPEWPATVTKNYNKFKALLG